MSQKQCERNTLKKHFLKYLFSNSIHFLRVHLFSPILFGRGDGKIDFLPDGGIVDAVFCLHLGFGTITSNAKMFILINLISNICLHYLYGWVYAYE